jgi:Xaa-Pro aminopeptidase
MNEEAKPTMDNPVGIPGEIILQRIEKTQVLMATAGLDGLIVVSSFQEREGHLAYLVNHHIPFPNAMSHVGLGFAAALLPATGKAALIAPLGFNKENVVGVDKYYDNPDLIAELIAAIKYKKLEDKRLGMVGMDIFPASYYQQLVKALPKATFSTADDLVESQRLIKSPEEVHLLRKAAQTADQALQAGLAAVRSGVSQIELESAVRTAALQAGVESISYIRVSSGKPMLALKWPMATRQLLQDGDFVYLQIGGWYQNYAFESSRVTVVGAPSQDQVEYLNHLVEATDWMIEEMKPGREFRFIMTESRARPIRPMGHGIGLELHENPWVIINKQFTLSPGMVLCVEPMVSTKEFGTMGIGETLLVTNTGVEALTCCPRVTW